MVVDAGRLRQRRQELGLSRDDLALRARVAKSTVQLVETEGRGAHATLAKLAAALGLEVGELAPALSARDGTALVERGLGPPPPPTQVQGRDAALAQVREAVRRPGLVCLVGPTGIGKTALARMIARELGAQGPVAWIRESRLGETFPAYDLQLAIAEALGFAPRLPPVSAPRESIDAVYREHAARKLRAIVIDDARSERFVRHFEAGTTLCTMHSRALAESVGGVVVELGALGRDDARALLELYLPRERLAGDAGAEQLLARLGGVPRSLHIAGRALRELAYVTPGDYAARIRLDPAAHADPGERGDPDERRDASQIAGYEELEASLPEPARRFFHALAPFGDRVFSLSWAAGAAGVELADAARESSRLRDRFLLLQVGAAGPEEPRFALDDHAAWYCQWRAGDTGATRRTLHAHATDRARALSRLPEDARSERYAADHDLWAIVLAPPALGRPWRGPDELARAGPPAGEPGTDPALAVALWRVLATRPGVLEDAALQSAYEQARAAPGSEETAARLALVAGMRLSAVERDQDVAARFLVEAGTRLAPTSPLAASNAWSGAARLVAASQGPSAGLELMQRAAAAALTGDASPLDRALRALDVAQIRVWADMASPPWETIDADLADAERWAREVEGRDGRAASAAVTIARQLLLWKRGAIAIADPALAAATEALHVSVDTSGFTQAALLALRAWALGPRGSTARRSGMARARAHFRRALEDERARTAWTDYGLAEIVWLVWLFRDVPWNEFTERAILGALDPWVGLAPAPYDPAQPDDPPRFGRFLGLAMPVACLAELLSGPLLAETARYCVTWRGPDDPDSQRIRDLAG